MPTVASYISRFKTIRARKKSFSGSKVLTVNAEVVALYDVIARLLSVSLQYGASLEKMADLLSGAKFSPCGPVSGHDRISLPDFIGRYLSLEYCNREDVAHG